MTTTLRWAGIIPLHPPSRISAGVTWLALENDIAWDLIRAVWSSVAVFAIAPLQDLFNLDTAARMNYPSRASGNWGWRFDPDPAINLVLTERMKELNTLYSRMKGR